MERNFEPKILVPALIWGPVTGAITAVIALLVSVGGSQGGDLASLLAACGWAVLFGGLVGVMCALPVGHVVAMTMGDGDPRTVARRAFLAAAVAAPVVTAAWLALAWLAMLLAWRYSVPLLLLVGVLAGLFMSRSARRIATKRVAERPVVAPAAAR